MRSFTTVLAISALTCLAQSTLAQPTASETTSNNEIRNAPKPKMGFTICQEVEKPFQAGPVVLQKAYRKYSVNVPSDVQKAAAKTDGSVEANPEQYDTEYLSPVTIGGQTLFLDFDTGSADLWVFSSELPTAQREGHSFYNPTLSQTSQELEGYSWNITYGDGSGASGNVYTDTVEVGGTTVTGQAVELASQISAQFQQDENNDGLLGLAFSSINTVQPQPQITFFDSAIAQGVLSRNLFTVDLKKGQPGTYDFGYIDDSKHTGQVTYVPVNSGNGFWEFPGTGYGIGSGTFQTRNIDAVADTGTTLLLLDNSIVAAYYRQVKGSRYSTSAGGYVFPCTATLPNFVVGLGGYKAVIPGSYINFAPVSKTSCYGGIQSNQGIGFSIYGDILLKAVFAVFDADNMQLGFAPKNL